PAGSQPQRKGATIMGALIGSGLTLPVANLEEGKGFGLGNRTTDAAGNEYVFCQANGAITGEGYVVVMDEAYQAAMLTTSNDTYGDLVGVAQAAFANDEYGWIMVKGVTNIRGESSALANSALAATADDGQVDDAPT